MYVQLRTVNSSTFILTQKKKKSLNSNVESKRLERNGSSATGYTACNKKPVASFIYTYRLHNCNGNSHFEGNGWISNGAIYVRYAGTAKLGSDHRAASTTRHGSDFLNSPTCRVSSQDDR